jgi:hypothetical protein
MSEHVTPDADPLGELLAPLPLPADDTLRGDLRERTGRVVRWRRRWRRMARAAALAACYAAGVLSMNGIGPHAPPPREITHNPEPPKPAVAPEGPALALEWEAIDSPQLRPDLYRRAGDRYLDDEGDPESALRCYGQALDGAAAADRAVAAEDSWLLMAIKNARQKEKSYATSGN